MRLNEWDCTAARVERNRKLAAAEALEKRYHAALEQLAEAEDMAVLWRFLAIAAALLAALCLALAVGG